MAGYIGSKSSVTLVDGYTEAEADAEFVTKTGDTMSGNLDVTGTVTADGLNVDGAALILIARNQVNLGHITRESHSESAALIQFSGDKMLTCPCNLLITCSA